jgi:hypothetical protein
MIIFLLRIVQHMSKTEAKIHSTIVIICNRIKFKSLHYLIYELYIIVINIYMKIKIQPSVNFILCLKGFYFSLNKMK